MSFQCFFFSSTSFDICLDTANDQFACQLQKYVFATLIILKHREIEKQVNPPTPTLYNIIHTHTHTHTHTQKSNEGELI